MSRSIDPVQSVICLKHHRDRTEEAYWHWINMFILFHHKRHPDEMAEAEITAFVSHLATNKNVSSSTHSKSQSDSPSQTPFVSIAVGFLS